MQVIPDSGYDVFIIGTTLTNSNPNMYFGVPDA